MGACRRSSVTLETLARVLGYNIPRLQRCLDEDHVSHMVQDQVAEYEMHGCFSMLQSMTVGVVESGEDAGMYLLDGQHRAKAFTIIREWIDTSDVVIPVVTYLVASKKELTDYYNRINKHMPIHPFETETAWEDFGKTYLEDFKRAFGAYCKSTDRCHTPHISLNRLKEGLSGRAVSNKLAALMKDTRDLWEKTLEVNEYIKTNRGCHLLDTAIRKRIQECEVKAEKHGCNVCYLGVWRNLEWLDLALEALREGISVKDCKAATLIQVAGRPFIPFALREQVWKKHNKNLSDHGECFTCGREIAYTDMECGHIKAHVLGGDTSFENLMPVCRPCNRDMGIMDLFEYKGIVFGGKV